MFPRLHDNVCLNIFSYKCQRIKEAPTESIASFSPCSWNHYQFTLKSYTMLQGCTDSAAVRVEK